jgi:spore coat protein GerQ
MAVVNYTEEDVNLLARLMRAEAEGDGKLGMLMVGNTGVNRVISDCLDFRQLRSIRDMVYQSPGAFEATQKGYFYQRAREQDKTLARRAIKGERFPPADRSLWFFIPRMKQPMPFQPTPWQDPQMSSGQWPGNQWQQQPQQMWPPFPQWPQPDGQLRIEESYIENILRLNRGKVATVYMTFENNNRWNAKVFKGIVEASGRDHIILSNVETDMCYLLLTIYLDYITFDEEINYEYPIR